jgi:hypothetical protein
MTDYTTLQKSVIKKALLLTLFAACTCLAFDLKAIAKGVALGGLFSVVDFKVMALLLQRRMTRQGKAGGVPGLFVRFVLLGIPLFLAIKLPSVNLAATVVGLFAVKAAIFYHFFLADRFLPAGNEE